MTGLEAAALGASGGDTMTGLEAAALGASGGDTMTGLAISKPAPESNSTATTGRLDFNAFGFIQ